MFRNASPLTRSLLWVMYQACDHGLHPQLIPYGSKGSDGIYSSAIVLNGGIYALHRLDELQTRPGRTQVHVTTAIEYEELHSFQGHLLHVIPRGYRQGVFVIPSIDLIDKYYADPPEDPAQSRIKVRIPLAYRPDHARFPYWDYRDRWDLIPSPTGVPRRMRAA